MTSQCGKFEMTTGGIWIEASCQVSYWSKGPRCFSANTRSTILVLPVVLYQLNLGTKHRPSAKIFDIGSERHILAGHVTHFVDGKVYSDRCRSTTPAAYRCTVRSSCWFLVQLVIKIKMANMQERDVELWPYENFNTAQMLECFQQESDKITFQEDPRAPFTEENL